VYFRAGFPIFECATMLGTVLNPQLIKIHSAKPLLQSLQTQLWKSKLIAAFWSIFAQRLPFSKSNTPIINASNSPLCALYFFNPRSSKKASLLGSLPKNSFRVSISSRLPPFSNTVCLYLLPCSPSMGAFLNAV